MTRPISLLLPLLALIPACAPGPGKTLGEPTTPTSRNSPVDPTKPKRRLVVYEYDFKSDPKTQDLDNNGAPDFNVNGIKRIDGALAHRPEFVDGKPKNRRESWHCYLGSRRSAQGPGPGSIWTAQFANQEEFSIEFQLELDGKHRGRAGVFGVLFQHPSPDIDGLYLIVDFDAIRIESGHPRERKAPYKIPFDNTGGPHTYLINRSKSGKYSLKIDGKLVSPPEGLPATKSGHTTLSSSMCGLIIGDIWGRHLLGGFTLHHLKLSTYPRPEGLILEPYIRPRSTKREIAGLATPRPKS